MVDTQAEYILPFPAKFKMLFVTKGNKSLNIPLSFFILAKTLWLYLI